MEWIQPSIKQLNDDSPQNLLMSPAFCSRDFVLTKTNARDSLHFQDIYQQYINYYASRYTFFTEASKFNFNYNYQIGSNKEDLNNLLDEYAENLP